MIRHLVLALVVSTATSGCAAIISRLVAPPGDAIVVAGYTLPAALDGPDAVRAGVGRVDITPPAGYPTGGHGPSGNMARGYWTRLYARAFYLQDDQRRGAVFVSADLFAIPGGLRAAVLRQVGVKWATRGVVLPPAAIVIAATHTHQSPGNFMTAGIYNGFASKYGGFDRALFDFLVERVSAAIDAAIQDALEHGPPRLLLARSRIVQPLLLNRSPSTFLLNWNASQLADRWHPEPVTACAPSWERDEAKATGWDLPGCPRLRAVDPQVTTLNIMRGAEFVGAMVFAAVHPTVLYHGAPVYSSDFTGAAVRLLERDPGRAAPGAPVIAFFNGAEGDVVARRARRDLGDVLTNALRFVTDVRPTLATGVPLEAGPIVAREMALTFGDRPGASEQLAKKPAVGVAALGGAEDDRTSLYQLGFREGVREVPTRDQGGKLPALDSQLLPIRVTSIVAPPRVFPQELPVALISVGSLRIGTMPGELSGAQGAAIRDALSKDGSFVLIGLANEYASYVSTADEYDAQDYMASSTIWGPRQGDALQEALMELASAGAQVLPLSVPEKRFSPGPKPSSPLFASFGPAAVGAPLLSPESELERIVLTTNGAPARNLPTVVWQEEIAPRDEFAATRHRRVEILERKGGAWQLRQGVPPTLDGTAVIDRVDDDDQGTGVLTLMHGSPDQRSTRRTMMAIWVSPVLENHTPSGEYRFRVRLEDVLGNVTCLQSMPFRVDLTPAVKPAPLAAAHCDGS